MERVEVDTSRLVVATRPARDYVEGARAREVIATQATRDLIAGAHTRDFIATRGVRDRVEGERTREVVAAGQVGPPGPPGPPGTASPIFSFAYGDAPSVIYRCIAAGALKQVSIVIDTAFNGIGAAIVVSVDSIVAMSAAENDPAHALEYQSAPAIPVSIGSLVTLTITPGAGATAGAGRLFLDF
jgi:hypothetical protein